MGKGIPLGGGTPVYGPEALPQDHFREQNPMMNVNHMNHNLMNSSASTRMAQTDLYAARRMRGGEEGLGSMSSHSSAIHNASVVNAGRNPMAHNQVGQYINQMGTDPSTLLSRERLARAQNLQMNCFRNEQNISAAPISSTANIREQLLRAQLKDEQSLRREEIYLEEILRLRERDLMRDQMLNSGLMPLSNLGAANSRFGFNPGTSSPHQLVSNGGGSQADLQMEQDRFLLQMQVQKYRAMNASFHQRNPNLGSMGASLNDSLLQDNLNPTALTRGRGSSLPGQCISTNNYNSSPAHHMPPITSGRGRDDINDNLIHYTKRNIIPLGTEDDQIWLSEFLCFLRAECVEVFRASKADVRYRKNSKKIKNDQVGIRCRFCAHLPHQARGSRSSSYPSSISRIYQSFTMMIRDHFSKCNDMRPDIRMKYNRLKASTTKGEMESKRYWTESASTLGLYDEPAGGILFRDNNSSPPK